jgi:hypothetical protein
VRKIQISLRTDAATHNAGYGGVMHLGSKAFRTRGFLTAKEQQSEFINEFEFMGFENSLWALLPEAVPDRGLWSQVHVSVELDNVTSIKYGRVAVSRSIRMSLKGAKFFDRVEEVGLELSFRHLAGELNVDADELSRRQSSHADWKLDPWLFRAINKALVLAPAIGLFASAQNTQVHRFFSFHLDHRAVAADAFLHSWSRLGTTYAYPPPILMGKVLQKLRVDCCRRSIVILPLWAAQPWYPTMLGMMTRPPVLLPNEEWIVADQMGTQCWPSRWPLVAVSLSGDLASAKASRRAYLNNAGRSPRTAIRRDMMAILHSSGSGGTLPTLLWNSVLQTFGLVC